jgi:hypothetical protein
MHEEEYMTRPRRPVGRIAIVVAAVVAAIAVQVVGARPAAAAPAAGLIAAQSGPDSTELKTAEAKCPSGAVVYGGGGDIVGGGHEVFLQQLDTFGYTDRFFAQAHEDADGYAGSWTLYAWAVCGPALPGMQYVSSRPAGDSTSFKATTVTCPAGKKVLSVGGSAIGYGGPLTTWRHTILDSLTPSADLTSVTVEGSEDEAGTSEAWQVSASAVCAYPRPNQQRVSATTSASLADKTRSVECPAGTIPYSAGGGLTGARGQAHLDRLVPHSESGLTGGDIDARTDENGTTAAWTASVDLICTG